MSDRTLYVRLSSLTRTLYVRLSSLTRTDRPPDRSGSKA